MTIGVTASAPELTNNDISTPVRVGDFCKGQRRDIAPLGEGDTDGFAGVVFIQRVGERRDP